ncbi:MAG: putative lipid II flippase FtsW [Deltaproteobacteria bacterium]|nr:putative lipid II flippase FtsW [Deltaproteobacteria bacterium]
MTPPDLFRVFHFKTTVSLFIVSFSLIGIGLIMIYSSSAIYAAQNWGDQYYFLTRQLIHFVIGLICLRVAIKLPYDIYKKIIPLLMLVCFILLLIVLIPGIGKQVGNARRWIRILGFGFQPSELLKLTLIIWAASFLDRRKNVLGYFSRAFLPTLIVMSIYLFLLLLQPDFGTAVLIALCLFLMIFVAGVKPSHMILSFTGVSFIGLILVVSQPYRLRRILGFLNVWEDPYDKGYQLIQSFIAIARGGIFGQDLGNSQQKLFFLPEAHTDFIFAIIAEETGFIGVVIVISLLAFLMTKGFEIALNCKDDFGRNLAFGITSLLTLQSLLNVLVVTGLIPTKGIPLPFISYGGSSLIISMFMLGILINIAGHLRHSTNR